MLSVYQIVVLCYCIGVCTLGHLSKCEHHLSACAIFICRVISQHSLVAMQALMHGNESLGTRLITT